MEIVDLATLHCLLMHVGEMLRKADHLSAFLCAFFYQARISLEIFLNVVTGAELH